MVLKLSLILNAAEEAAKVAGAPAGSNGSTPTPAVPRTRRATAAGGLPSRSSTNPAAVVFVEEPGQKPLNTVFPVPRRSQLKPKRGDQLSASIP